VNQTYPVVRMELDKTGRYAEFVCADMVHGRVQARQVTGTPWGAAVIKFYGSASDDLSYFDEIDASVTLTAEGLSAKIDLLGIRRLRAVVATASSTAGALVEICFCSQNPYLVR
jgi:hypothetical protein